MRVGGREGGAGKAICIQGWRSSGGHPTTSHHPSRLRLTLARAYRRLQQYNFDISVLPEFNWDVINEYNALQCAEGYYGTFRLYLN